MDFLKSAVGNIEYIITAVSVLFGLFQAYKKYGALKVIKRVITGIDIGLADPALPAEAAKAVRGAIKEVSVKGGVDRTLAKMVTRVRSDRQDRNKKLGLGLKLDEKGRPSGEINFGMDF